MKRYLLVILCVLLVGCASSITTTYKDGVTTMVAKDYTINQKLPDGSQITLVPNRWFNMEWLNGILTSIGVVSKPLTEGVVK